MRLRNAKDRRTMLWALTMPVVVGAQYARPSLIGWLTPLACYLALCAGVMAHNHNHCPTFKDRKWNRWYGYWLSLFYGYPTFAWIPTHNLNHHKYVNGPGDATITWRYTNRHSLPVALTYFFVSSWFQSGPINDFIRKARDNDRRLYREIMLQYAVWGGAAVALLALAIGLHGVRTGLLVWAAASVLPAVFALWTIMLFNYEQHVHADPASEHSHSRSWTGGLLNFMLFNNGLHAAHHEQPGLHWSELRRAHEELAPKIHPSLIEGGMTWYFVKCYLLAPLFPRFGTKQLGPEPTSALDLTGEPDVAMADGE